MISSPVPSPTPARHLGSPSRPPVPPDPLHPQRPPAPSRCSLDHLSSEVLVCAPATLAVRKKTADGVGQGLTFSGACARRRRRPARRRSSSGGRRRRSRGSRLPGALRRPRTGGSRRRRRGDRRPCRSTPRSGGSPCRRRSRGAGRRPWAGCSDLDRCSQIVGSTRLRRGRLESSQAPSLDSTRRPARSSASVRQGVVGWSSRFVLSGG